MSDSGVRPGWGLRLTLSLAVPFTAAALGGWATASGVVDWYPSLAKPSFNPPASVFGPVWTVLYLLMGISLFLIWERAEGTAEKRRALTLFAFQLGLNAAWSVLFFGLRLPGWALLDLILLWIALLATVVLFFCLDRWAGWLLVPYLVWVSFAGVLNGSIWVLNR